MKVQNFEIEMIKFLKDGDTHLEKILEIYSQSFALAIENS